ncbi:DUF1178 family protein [Limnobacter alexandrii]|uniref:DUF1178 family protein n=1 Tax=Limnobacter alexandrii TaxID=2570352 RepID=UPI0014868F4B|nr:DUF1178 family protein [Limnobacter alexandrii]
MAIIIYDLECEYSHRFEGWFRSNEDFDEQREQKLLTCPECGTSAIRKVPSKINIGSKAPVESKGSEAKSADVPAAPAVQKPNSVDVATAFVMARQAIQALINHSEDVGDRFAEEARKIHYEEAPIRAIRGQASPEEFEELRDEGIEVIALPVLPSEEELN